MGVYTSSPLSSSPPPPLSASVSKSSTVYSLVHSVTDHNAKAGFSSVSSPLYTSGHKDKIQKDSSTILSYTDSIKKAQISSIDVDSFTCNNKTSAHLSREISSPLLATNCENGHSSLPYVPVSLMHKHERKYESSLNNNKIEHTVHKTTQEKFDDGKLAEHDHMKVSVSLCISTAYLKLAC